MEFVKIKSSLIMEAFCSSDSVRLEKSVSVELRISLSELGRRVLFLSGMEVNRKVWIFLEEGEGFN